MQTSNGSLAAEFNRAFVPGGDLARSKRQNLFMQALQDKIISAGILPKVPNMAQKFDKMIVTDLSPKQLVSLACMAKAIPKAASPSTRSNTTWSPPARTACSYQM